VPGARVFVDDLDLGRAPVLVRAGVGEHALRVQAEGHLAYGARLEVAQGARAEQHIALAPDAPARAIASAHAAARTLDVVQLRAALAELQREQPEVTALVALLAASDGTPRALALRCDRERCTGPTRLVLQDGRLRVSEARDAEADPAALAQARVWLAASDVPGSAVAAESTAPAPGFWGRWYVWSGLALLAVGAGTLIGALATPDPEHRLHVVVNQTDTP
ncbi:MAG TPA: PEGA domain-containing protein, partial [Polyangiales bacterium]|nr:PEGA domain-containing protein [Polyangiales bacterium]